jgi:cytoskeletal protein RodZ
VGSELSSARQAAGLSIQDIADSTRLRRTVIEGIEADDFTHCGGDVYARGHVRNIARLVGLDPEAVVAEFDRQHAPVAPSAAEVLEAETTMRPERRTPNWAAAMAVVVVVVLGIGVVQLLRGGGGSTGEPPRAAAVTTPAATRPVTPSPKPSSASAAPTTSVSAPPAATASASSSVVAQVPPSAQGVTVQVTISGGKSWLSVTTGAAGTVAYEGILPAGSSRTFTDPTKIKLTIGNAGAVHLIVNGKDLGSPGSSGQVVHLSFGPGDPSGAG